MQLKAFAAFHTSSASRYLGMLCDHFGTRLKARCDANGGWVEFPSGRCEMTADERHLVILVSADEQSQLEHVKQIITNHLERFAFRENPILDWQEPSN